MNELNIKEIKQLRDLVLTDMLNENDVKINGSILRKLDEQLIIPRVGNRRELLKFLNWLDAEDDFKEDPLINESIVDEYLKL